MAYTDVPWNGYRCTINSSPLLVAFGTGVAFVALTPLVGVGLFLIGTWLATFVPDYVHMVLHNKGEREREP